MRAPALLPPAAGPRRGASAPAPAYERRARRAELDAGRDARMLEAIEQRVMRPVQAKAAVDTGYGDLIAAARAFSPRRAGPAGSSVGPVQRACCAGCDQGGACARGAGELLGRKAPATSAPSGGAPAATPNARETQTFKGCDDDQASVISGGVKGARKLAETALDALDKGLPHQQRALKDNFGDVSKEKKRTIITRYSNIRDTLDGKDISCSSTCPTKPGTDLCAQGAAPGNKIIICPQFGEAGCDPNYTILHEAAHNAGAQNDIEKGGGYPPADSENNAYSYELFVQDVLKGAQDVGRLGTHVPQGPE